MPRLLEESEHRRSALSGSRSYRKTEPPTRIRAAISDSATPSPGDRGEDAGQRSAQQRESYDHCAARAPRRGIGRARSASYRSLRKMSVPADSLRKVAIPVSYPKPDPRPGSGADSGVIGVGAVVIAPGDQPPRDEFGLDWSALPVDRGEVVVVSCPPADAEVVELTPTATIVRWPWPDPDIDQDADLLAVLTDRTRRQPTMWRYDPDPADRQLAVGDRIRVSIPDCVVNVNYTEAHFYPAPSSIDEIAAGTNSADGYEEVFMAVLPYGVSECKATVEEPDLRIRVGLYGPEPVAVRLVHRPYAWLVDGDQVLDPGANRWSFHKPLGWVEKGRSEPGAPLATPQ